MGRIEMANDAPRRVPSRTLGLALVRALGRFPGKPTFTDDQHGEWTYRATYRAALLMMGVLVPQDSKEVEFLGVVRFVQDQTSY